MRQILTTGLEAAPATTARPPPELAKPRGLGMTGGAGTRASGMREPCRVDPEGGNNEKNWCLAQN
jgi:hypothetical protein